MLQSVFTNTRERLEKMSAAAKTPPTPKPVAPPAADSEEESDTEDDSDDDSDDDDDGRTLQAAADAIDSLTTVPGYYRT